MHKKQDHKVEKVQRRATKLVRACRNMPYPERLDYLNLHSLSGRRTRGDLIETYKIFNSITDLKWDKLFLDIKSDTNTRNTVGKVFKRRCNTNMRMNCFSNRVTNHWNDLKPELKTAKNLNTFKNQLDTTPKFKDLFKEFH